MRSIFWIVLFIACMPACSLNKPYVIDEDKTVGSLGSKVAITVIDTRPSDDRKFNVGSFMVFKSNYGIMTLGDESFSPPLNDLLRIRLHRHIADWKEQPKEIRINLSRMIFQSNHQADLLQGASMSGGIGPLGVLIAENLHGKEFELDYDKTRPFVVGYVQATVDLTFDNNKKIKKEISISKIENFPNYMDAKGRELAAISVANQVIDSFAENLGND